MGIRDLIASFGVRKNLIRWRVDPAEGIDFILDDKALASPEVCATENLLLGMQLAYLRGLFEQSLASKNSNGFTIPSAVIVDLGEDFISLFDFPDTFSGQYITRIEGNTGKSSFAIAIDLQMPDGSRISNYSLQGPLLKVAENEIYSLSPPEWRALKAISDHDLLSDSRRGEYENNWLILQLQIAKKAGMKIDLAHFNNLEIVSPDSVGVAMEVLANGDILLTPSFGGGARTKDVKARLGQLSGDEEHCILRVKNRFVLLDKKRLEAAKEILTNRKIPKDQVSNFLKSPTAYLNAALIDLDMGFSLRVHGAEKFSHRYFGDVEKSGVDWFSNGQKNIEPTEILCEVVNDKERLLEVEATIRDALGSGADWIEVDDRQIDISDSEKVERIIEIVKRDIEEGVPPKKQESAECCDDVEPKVTEKAVVAIDSNDDAIDFAKNLHLIEQDLPQQIYSKDNLKRSPFPHQEEGIGWILSHLDFVRKSKESSGALLADDMGLGKTYMTLVSISEWYKRSTQAGLPQKPVLIVAPLSLLENWQSEVDATFEKSPFSDIVVLQAGGDLSRFRMKGASRETQQEFSDLDRIEDHTQIRYSLKVGSVFGSDRLDMPGRLVLTTYQTLRDYQFSLSRVDWSIVVFDEAQNLKNPNALASRAAKGLKADFKLLATGTPVENSLKDFWCIFDTAVPGLLGAWQSFRQEYIAPITSAEITNLGMIKLDIGRKLRVRVGGYMLRRTKSEQLKGLPEKRIFSGDESAPEGRFMPELAAVMRGAQLSCYDEIISNVKNSKKEDKQRIILASLRRLKVTSIHQDIEQNRKIAKSAKDLIAQAETSSKIKSMLQVLREIEKRNEKVLIFSETKAIQAYVSALVTTLFHVPVEIINGETAAVVTKANSDTRKSIIDRFQSGEGFGVIVMSPVAAGVGLTVVGANNVIHLERHWNPAKEAQATDRVYRIGQKRDVNVYLPMALHPIIRSFDLQLNGLLANKIDLSEAVVATPSIEPQDLSSLF